MTTVLPSSREPQDQVLHLARADRVEAARRLVEQDQLRLVDQRLGQADAARHALGVFFQLPFAGPVEADHLDQLVDPLLQHVVRDVEQPAVEVERLLGIQEAVQIRLFRQVADPLVLADVGGVFAEDQGLALGRETAGRAAA